MPVMNDWFRSLTALGMAFAAVVVTTLGLAAFIVPDWAVSSQATDETAPDPAATLPEPEVGGGIPGLGGTLTVTRDRQGTFRLSRGEETGSGYGLVGDDARVTFAGDPLTVTQMNIDGWSFYPEPDECTVRTGKLDDAVGIGTVELRCGGVADVRGNGVISLTGTIGLPIDLLVARELPPSGGRVEVGDETWEFNDAMLRAWPMPIIGGDPESRYHMRLFARRASVLNFFYDAETHALTLASVERVGEAVDVSDDACDLRTQELGTLSPRTTVIELTIQCLEVDVPGLGPVSISGTLIVDRLEFPN
jgi:hypothetical protein